MPSLKNLALVCMLLFALGANVAILALGAPGSSMGLVLAAYLSALVLILRPSSGFLSDSREYLLYGIVMLVTVSAIFGFLTILSVISESSERAEILNRMPFFYRATFRTTIVAVAMGIASIAIAVAALMIKDEETKSTR